jgi:hypothetical protein
MRAKPQHGTAWAVRVAVFASLILTVACASNIQVPECPECVECPDLPDEVTRPMHDPCDPIPMVDCGPNPAAETLLSFRRGELGAEDWRQLLAALLDERDWREACERSLRAVIDERNAALTPDLAEDPSP